eukprot:TRINITY_DN11124_c0_g1_i5.p1 TRINITY_DN11124_c0_g1~~TRINITY_DN11124_c0_g1_i5.p1  ORF type:complete len:146 (+),score=48.72 TRINITY_DN11124_c0_g1_i5:62-439(+)
MCIRDSGGSWSQITFDLNVPNKHSIDVIQTPATTTTTTTTTTMTTPGQVSDVISEIPNGVNGTATALIDLQSNSTAAVNTTQTIPAIFEMTIQTKAELNNPGEEVNPYAEAPYAQMKFYDIRVEF